MEEEKNLEIVKPVMTPAAALDSFKNFQQIKEKVLTEDDKKPIAGKPYINKSGWRKIKWIFNLSQEIKHSSREEKDGIVRWEYRVRVSTKSGLFADADGMADTSEEFAWADKEHKKKKPESMIQAMAQTRAFNRAISDLVGGGETSYEEEGNNKEVNGFQCEECRKNVTQKVAEFSKNKFNRIFCMDHQKK